MGIIQWLDGKKTILGGLAAALIGAVWSLDQLLNGGSGHYWFTQANYEAAGLLVASLTGISMRLGISKSQASADAATSAATAAAAAASTLVNKIK